MGKKRRPCLGLHARHEWEPAPEGREKCRRCQKLNPLGIPVYVRFWDHVDKNGANGCWLWIGRKAHDGYGLYTITDGEWRYDQTVHRYAWFLMRGKFPPPGLEFDHICRVRNCVNPAHLRFLTKRENLHAIPTYGFCRHGHKYEEGNHYTYVSARGYTIRKCKVCVRPMIRRCSRAGGCGQLKPLDGPRICPCKNKMKA